jgi:AAA family ATP:ADP antiporter
MIQAEYTIRTLKVMLKSLSTAFTIPRRQLPRVFFHGFILFFIIAGFWLLDSLKDPILSNLVGIEYQPIAKFLSVLTTFLVVCMYDCFTSITSKPTLFHMISIGYGLITLIIAGLLSDPIIGLENRVKNHYRLLGWLAYFTIESYGSLMVALFWSYTNSIMNLEQAKGAYGLIISIAQIGAIFGATLATQAKQIGLPILFLIGSMLIFSISLLIKSYHIVFRDPKTESIKGRIRGSFYSDTDEEVIYKAKIKGSESNNNTSSITTATLVTYVQSIFGGFVDGLFLILQYNYTLKLLGISCLFEIIVTVLDYEFKILGAESVSTDTMSLFSSDTIAIITTSKDKNSQRIEDDFANLLGHFGQATNIISLLVSLLGFSYIVHRFSVRMSLLIYPSVLFSAVIITNLVPSLKVLFVMVSILKALAFSLNEPVKELLYIPTSESIKFKAKAWIDVFGCRSAKAIGSLLTSFSYGDANRLRMISEMPCIIISLVILALAWSIGTDFQELVQRKRIVGDDTIHPVYDLGSYTTSPDLKIYEGKRPGEVGYSGYDLHLFQGVFDDDDDSVDTESIDSRRQHTKPVHDNDWMNLPKANDDHE